MICLLVCFVQIWVFDYEYIADPGERPIPVCLVAIEVRTGQTIRIWRDQLDCPCPFDTSEKTLFVTFAGIGDWQCFTHFGWPTPKRMIDLYPEVRQQFYDRDPYISASLLHACQFFGVPIIESAEKDRARDLIIHHAFDDSHAEYLLAYCESDVVATLELFRKMLPILLESREAFGGALFRGRYMFAMSRVEHCGIAMDVETYTLIKDNLDAVSRSYIDHVDREYQVYEDGTFKMAKFKEYLARHQIPWPLLDSGEPDLEDDTFRKQAAKYPQLQNLRELRHLMGSTRLLSYPIGSDGRNRVFLNPFGSVTGRNQPSSSKFIFGSARWARSFIKAPKDRVIAYIDYSNQEFAIGAAISGDEVMWRDYVSGDPYLAFAITAGLAPLGATKTSHKNMRNVCKALVLGIGYGMSAKALALGNGLELVFARSLIALYYNSYSKYAQMCEDARNYAALNRPLRTTLHWVRQIKAYFKRLNERSNQNFLMQGNGSDMIRLAVCLLTENGIDVCCSVHDALLIEVPYADYEKHIELARELMGQASEVILGPGKRCRTDVQLVMPGEIFIDEKAGEAYEVLLNLVNERVLKDDNE